MRIAMRPLALLVPVLAAFLACSSEQVAKAPMCSDPCCGGNSALLDCGESSDVTCTQSGDPCSAQLFGCSAGAFFMRPQASLPASCASDAALDATIGDDDATPVFEDADEADVTTDAGLDAPADAGLDAPAEAAIDAPGDGPAAATDGAPDAPADGP
jgi:hypothetical protein